MFRDGWRAAAAAFVGLALVSCGDAPASAEYDFTGSVTEMVDGDTFYMTGQPVRIRVWGLSAPETRHPGGPAAARALTDLIAGRPLGCKLHHIDRYKRPVAQCWLEDGRDIAEEMIASGTATEYCRYSGGHYGACGG